MNRKPSPSELEHRKLWPTLKRRLSACGYDIHEAFNPDGNLDFIVKIDRKGSDQIRPIEITPPFGLNLTFRHPVVHRHSEDNGKVYMAINSPFGSFEWMWDLITISAAEKWIAKHYKDELGYEIYHHREMMLAFKKPPRAPRTPPPPRTRGIPRIQPGL